MNIFDLLVVQPIFNLLIFIYGVLPGGDFGVAIIIFTVIVRFLLYPLTRSMLHQTRAMRKLQPELVKIKKRAGKDRQKAAMLQMELYKKNSINPFRPILILLIQLPIFIALFYVIRIFTDNRGEIAKFTYDFLETIPAIQSVIQDPAGFSERLFGVVELARPALHANGIDIFLVLIALIAAGTQYILSKQTMPTQSSNKRLRDIMAEAAEGKQADQAEMNAIVMEKMTKVLPFIMFAVMISLPGALALYYATSNIVAVIQQHYLLKQDEEELQEIADEVVEKQPAKKATKKAAEKQAKETSPKSAAKTKSQQAVTRVVAKPTAKKRRKS